MAKQRKGFACMSAEQRRAISRLGGKAVHAKGTGRRWTPEEARRYSEAAAITKRLGR